MSSLLTNVSMMQRCALAGSAAAFVLSQILGRMISRQWFALTGFAMNCTLSMQTMVVDAFRFVGVPKSLTERVCRVLSKWAWWGWIKLNPQINIRRVGGNTTFAEVPKGSIVLLNHTSFFDTLVFTQLMPSAFVQYTSAIYKSSLSKLPVLGPLFKRCGHFPVFFKGSELNDFSVDKERQAKVTADMDAFLGNKMGYLSMFPEGAINPDPTTLRPFRHGSFSLALQHTAPLYAFLQVGSDKSWPAAASIGGLKSEIKYRLVKLDVDYSASAAELALSCNLQMQKHLDELMEA